MIGWRRLKTFVQDGELVAFRNVVLGERHLLA
jgi:hypothetical protein